MLLTFFLAVVGWILFRAESIGQAWDYVCSICDGNLSRPIMMDVAAHTTVFVGMMLLIEWIQRGKEHGLGIMERIKSVWMRVFIYYLLVVMILEFNGSEQSFIYFQF